MFFLFTAVTDAIVTKLAFGIAEGSVLHLFPFCVMMANLLMNGAAKLGVCPDGILLDEVELEIIIY